MPRPKRQTIFAIRGVTEPEARATLQPSIQRLLSFANATQRPDLVQFTGYTGPEVIVFANDVHRVLTLISQVPAGGFHDWPEWAALAFNNLHWHVRSGHYHLRRCRLCTCWMHVKHSGRLKCNRPACARMAKTRQKASERDVHRILDRGAIARARTF